jgi:hypothetical protein
MSAIPPEELSRRSDDIEHAMETVASLLLGTMPVIRYLGRTAGQYQNILSEFYIPNLRDGRLVTPREHRNEESLPIFSLRANEAVSIDENMTTLHVDQIAMLQGLSAGNEGEGNQPLIDEVRTKLHESFRPDKQVSLNVADIHADMRPRTLTSKANINVGQLPKIVQGRPAIFLVAHSTDPESVFNLRRSDGLSLLHQIVHVDQILHNEPTATTRFNVESGIYEDQADSIVREIAKITLRDLPKFR